MITRADMDYHLEKMRGATTEATRHEWAETLYLPFAVPERRLFGNIYVLARPGLGVTLCDIKIFEGLTRSRYEASYSDNRQHLPAPATFSAFSLPNGLAIDISKGPDRYIGRYIGHDDTSLEIELTALMPAYDIHDPDMDPKARKSAAEQAANSGYGASYGGHYDQTCRVRGQLILRGEKIDIDYVDVMDRSWGPRGEQGCPGMAWTHAIIDENYMTHQIWSLDITAPGDRQFTFAHGYLLENGKVYGLTDATMSVDRVGVWGSSYLMSVTDIRGKTHRFHGAPMASGLWECYGCVGVPNIMNRWVGADGRVGYGELQEGIFYDSYTTLRARGRLR